MDCTMMRYMKDYTLLVKQSNSVLVHSSTNLSVSLLAKLD